jgi:short-subunit dehydrogenase
MEGKKLDLNKYGPWALVVGGSDGSGEAFVRRLAAQGFKVVIAARRPEPLKALADALRAQGAEIRTVSVDMVKPDALDLVRGVTDDIEVGLLVYNCGVVGGPARDFVKQETKQYRDYIALNVTGQADFSHYFGGLMCDRGRGGIILTGSTASFMGSSALAAYCGVKAFSRIFSEGLWLECEKYGVDVLHFCLQLTDTPTNRRLQVDVSAGQSSDDAAREALDNIAKGPVVIAGGEETRARAQQRSLLTGRATAVRAWAIKDTGNT